MFHIWKEPCFDIVTKNINLLSLIAVKKNRYNTKFIDKILKRKVQRERERVRG